MGVTLKDVKEISVPGAPLKDSLFIASTNINTWVVGPEDAQAVNEYRKQLCVTYPCVNS